jgi:DNA-binding HxlR family transcriptional regulator
MMSMTMEAEADHLAEFCPKYEEAISILGKRWTGLILRALLSGSCRFSAISGYVPGLSDRLLSERLKELEANGIVQRQVYAETPVRVEYLLTPKGEDLRQIVAAVQSWADVWLPSNDDALESAHDLGRRGAEAYH